MDTALLAAPPGFAAGCRDLSNLAATAPTRAVAIASQAARGMGVGAPPGGADAAAAAAAALVCRAAQGVDAALVAKTLAACTDLSEAAVRVLVEALAATGGASAAAPTGASALAGGGAGGVPRLAGVDWAVTVATHSSASAALGTVLAHLTLRTDAGAPVAAVFTLPQLVALETAVREAGVALES
jgi:hypothetical protein